MRARSRFCQFHHLTEALQRSSLATLEVTLRGSIKDYGVLAGKLWEATVETLYLALVEIQKDVERTYPSGKEFHSPLLGESV